MKSFGIFERLDKMVGETETLIASAGSLEAAMPKVLELLGLAFRCDWGTFWKVDAKSYVLRSMAIWKRMPNVDTNALEKDTRGRRLSMSEGTAGHVWRSGRPVWTTDLHRDMCLPRSLEASCAGLKAGVWFAVKIESTVYGVFEFLGSQLPKMNEASLTELERFGQRLGTEIEKSFSKP